jgi:hypothetical protein
MSGHGVPRRGSVRHCERSEATQTEALCRPWFALSHALLAMTWRFYRPISASQSGRLASALRKITR